MSRERTRKRILRLRIALQNTKRGTPRYKELNEEFQRLAGGKTSGRPVGATVSVKRGR